MIKAIIFDFDGVLSDNTNVVVKVYQQAAVLCGKKIPSRKKVISALGLPGPAMIRRVIGKNPKFRAIQLRVWEKYEPEMKLVGGLESALKKIKLPKAIVTSRRLSKLNSSLGKSKKYFSFFITPRDTGKHKPNPEPLLLACQKLKINPAQAIYVGDTLIDWQAARKAKIEFVGVLSGAYTKKEFQARAVKYFIKTLKELPTVIKKIEWDE